MSEGRATTVPGDTRKFNPEFDIVSSRYFETLRVPALRGRTFTAADDRVSTTAPMAIVDSRLAQLAFGGADAVGRVLQVPLRENDRAKVTYTIAGVVPPIRHDLFHNAGVGAGGNARAHRA